MARGVRAHAVRAAFDDPGVSVTAMSQRVDGEGLLYRWIESAANGRVRRFGMVYGDSGLGVRRAAYLAAGGFSDLPLFEDVDLSRRLARNARPQLVESARLHVSPRRWQREGVIGRSVRNWALTVGYWMGVDPRRLARYYPAHSEPSRSEPQAVPNAIQPEARGQAGTRDTTRTESTTGP